MKFRSLLLCTLSFVALFSCRPQKGEEASIFRYNQLDGIETLDPAFAKSLSIMWPVKFLYNTLVEIDSALHLQPSLAKRWEVSGDGLTYTFHLRTDVFFHDDTVFPGGAGRRLTAGDVVYSFNRLVDPETASAGAWIFNDRLAGERALEAPNDSTFVLRLRSPFAPLLEMLSMPYCSVVAHEAVEKWGKDFRSHPCGTGPFRFVFWDEGSQLFLKRNPNYWERDETGRPLPYLEGVNVSFNETRAMEFLRFQQNELDFMNGIDGAMQDLILTKRGELRPEYQKSIRLHKKTYLNTEYLGFQMADSSTALQHPKVRQAINYAIDRKKIVTYFRNGIGVPAERGFIPKGMPGTGTSDIQGYTYSPEKARQCLAEAGYPNGQGLPVIHLSTPDANVDICNFIVRQLTDVGIPARVSVVQKSFLRQQMSEGQLPFFKAQWIADYPDAESFLAFFYSPLPAPPNYTRYQNPTFDRWYERSLRAPDSLRLRLYGQMDSLMMIDAPVVPLYYDELIHLTKKNVLGFQSNSLNMIDLRRVRKIQAD